MRGKAMFNAILKTSVLVGSIWVTMNTAFAQDWVLTPQSKVTFDIRSAGMSIVNGQFHKYQANMNFDPASPNAGSVKFVMDVGSLTFSKNALKEMILGESFFNLAQHKTVTFQSHSVKSLGNQKYRFDGQLTLRGVTKPVSFDTTLKAQPNNSDVLNVVSTTVINRSDFGMRKAIGGVGEKVNIKLEGQWRVK